MLPPLPSPSGPLPRSTPDPPEPSSPRPPPRSGCLTLFLLASIAIAGLGSVALLLGGPPVQSLLDAAPPWLGYYVFIANLVEIVLLLGVWYRQRWGVYGLIGGTILSVAIDRLIPVSPLNDVVSLLELGLLIFLVHADWDYFQPPPLAEYSIGVRPLIGLVAIGVMLYGASFVLVKPGGWAGAAATPTPVQSALPPTPLPTITPFPLRSGPITGCAEPTPPIASNSVLCVSVIKPAVSPPSPPLLMSDADTHFAIFGGPSEQLELRVWGDQLWDLTFATEPNTLFHLGQYLAPWPSKAGRMAQPGVRLAGTITDCSNGLGRFTVLDLDYDFASQQVQRFAANFEVYCDVDVVNGAVRFHSDVPLSAVDPPAPSPTPLPTLVPLSTDPLVVPAAVNFEQYYDGGPALLGVLRYQSTVPP